MFEGDKYMTRGIQAEVGFDLQLIMWGMIDELVKNKEVETDYLQVFELKTEIRGIHDKQQVVQHITHSQEVPEYKKKIEIIAENPINGKIFVISSHDEKGKEYSTMMFSYEY